MFCKDSSMKKKSLDQRGIYAYLNGGMLITCGFYRKKLTWP